MGPVDSDQPLAQVQEHGAHHPLPRLERNKRMIRHLHHRGASADVSCLTIGGFPANSGTAQPDSFRPQSSNWAAQDSGMLVFWLADVCPRTIRLTSEKQKGRREELRQSPRVSWGKRTAGIKRYPTGPVAEPTSQRAVCVLTRSRGTPGR